MCKFKVGDKVKTRDGADVEIIHIDDRLSLPIVGIHTRLDGSAVISVWSKDGIFLRSMKESRHDIIPPSRTVTLYHALVRTIEGRYFSPYDLFSGLDDDGIEDWNSGGYKVVRLLTEYPIEVEE